MLLFLLYRCRRYYNRRSCGYTYSCGCNYRTKCSYRYKRSCSYKCSTSYKRVRKTGYKTKCVTKYRYEQKTGYKTEYRTKYSYTTVRKYRTSYKYYSCTCQASGTKKGYDSSGTPRDCKFPFKNGHKLYKGCASSSNGAFCATEVSSKGVLTKWARCNEYCDNDEGNVFFLKDI